MVKVSWIGQLMLVYSWTRPAILVSGKGRGGIFLFLLLLHFHSSFFPVPLFHLLYYLFSRFLWEMTHKGTQRLTLLDPNTISQSITGTIVGYM